jgi:hypothetical protein
MVDPGEVGGTARNLGHGGRGRQAAGGGSVRGDDPGALRQLPAGGEVGGTLPSGVTWYVRVPPAGQENRDEH